MKLITPLIALRRVALENPDDVEFIRTARNGFIGKDVYAIEHFIEIEEHLKWFSTLDSTRDCFFTVIPNGRQTPVGFVGCYQRRAPAFSGEISIYITDPSVSPLVPFHAMTLLLEFMFHELKLRRAYGAFFPKNQRAIRFNGSFGFKQFAEDDEMIYTELTADEYGASSHKYRRFLGE